MKKYAYKIRLIIAGVVLMLAALAIWGIYPVKVLDLQFIALLQRIVSTHAYTAIALFLFVILLTSIFGRFYCSTICPFGILQEFASFLLRRKKKNVKSSNFVLKYFLSALALGALFAGSAVLIRYIDPYSIFGSAISLTTFGIIFTLCIFILVFFKNRFFCSNICPVGSVLGICAKNSFKTLNILQDKCVSCKMCERNCPVGCISVDDKKINNEMCIKCLKCYSVCPKGAISYSHQHINFSPSRRKTILGISVAAVLVSGYAIGLKFTKELVKNIKNIILPAGAKDFNRMANKCINCNLCIQNCPNKILVKADNKFGAVHIDYSKGEGYCKFDCHNCGEVCPSGAIERISLKEKQNTRIAMAVIKSDECIKCGLCSVKCPKGAITKEEGQIPVIDASKCIGCGKCKKICPKNSIEIYGIKEQTII